MLLPSWRLAATKRMRGAALCSLLYHAGSGNDSGAANYRQANDLVGTSISHAGGAARPVDHNRVVLPHAAGALYLLSLMDFLCRTLLRAGAIGSFALCGG